ncbi:MAG: transketolase [Flavobacteriales bacterium]|jgi:transketolase
MNTEAFITKEVTSIENLEKIASQVRRDVLRMVHAVSSGHPGGSLGCADLGVALYFKIMEHHAKSFTMDGVNEDMFFLSNGHISPMWYSVLARSGYFEVSELATFRKINSRLQGHPATEEGLEGIRIASGSLGQGLSVSLGAAMTKKMNEDNHTVYCLMGDGELQEGQVWEAAMFAAHNKIDNVIALVDLNGRQIDGDVDQVLSLGDLEGKWKAFGWETHTVDGNNMAELIEKIEEVKGHLGAGKPQMILMRTEMGYGVDFMMGTHKWHGVAPNDDQLTNALSQLEETMGDY